jgi:hypothetical protein
MENELQIERFRNETESNQSGAHSPLFRFPIAILVSSSSEIGVGPFWNRNCGRYSEAGATREDSREGGRTAGVGSGTPRRLRATMKPSPIRN